MRVRTAILLATVSFAALGQVARADDSQIEVATYSPLKRTEVVGIVGQPTTITFPKGESVYRVVQTGKPGKDGILQDAGWQGADPKDIKDTPLGPNLTLWPVATGMSTMSVITMNSEGTQKVYAFRMVAITAADAVAAPNVTLNLIFTGTASSPAAPVGSAAQAPIAAQRVAWQRLQREKEQARERLRADASNGTDGACHYHAQGKRPTAIEPRCPMDNGEWTLMRFPGLSKKPAVYVVTGEDEERLARQHGSGDFVVVEEIAAHYRLRLGPDVLDIVNEARNAAGTPAGGGTISPTVHRDLLQARAP